MSNFTSTLGVAVAIQATFVNIPDTAIAHLTIHSDMVGLRLYLTDATAPNVMVGICQRLGFTSVVMGHDGDTGMTFISADSGSVAIRISYALHSNPWSDLPG